MSQFPSIEELPPPAEFGAELVASLDALPDRRTASLRQLRRTFSGRLKHAAAAYVMAVAWKVLENEPYRWIAYELIYHHRAAFRSLDRVQLEALGRGINSWDTVDSFGRTLSGPAWRDGIIIDEPVHAWAGSADRWWRRAALVSTVALNMRSQGGRGDVDRTLAVCRLLVADKDDMVIKAMSWALRMLVDHDPAAVTAFLNEHQDRLAARVKREVTNKLRTGYKNP